MTDDAVARARAILRDACGDRVRSAHPLAPLTSFRIGGPAALYLEPESDDDLAAASRALRETGLPYVVLGKGSNVLVHDAGFPGLVLRLGRTFRWAARAGTALRAGGAMPLPALAGVALRHALDGLAFGVAIPATLGGAIRMNAGAHGREIANVIEEVDVFRLLTGERTTVPAVEAGFSYRRSGLASDAVVTAGRVGLAAGEPAEIRAAMDEARDWRRRTQPIAEPNCGSVFRNPETGPAAARLVEDAGAKGLRVGGATVSSKHANFIVAGPGTRAADVIALIDRVRALVERDTGIVLETEVHLIGDDAHATA